MDPIFFSLHQLLSFPDDMDKLLSAPARSFVVDTKAMASTPADVKEYRDHYLFVLDMPGLKSSDIKVQIENGNVLTIIGEREPDEKDESEAKYLRMERRMGKLMRNFTLPPNANAQAISASCHDGVLMVKVPKIPPPEPKKPKTVEISVA